MCLWWKICRRNCSKATIFVVGTKFAPPGFGEKSGRKIESSARGLCYLMMTRVMVIDRTYAHTWTATALVFFVFERRETLGHTAVPHAGSNGT